MEGMLERYIERITPDFAHIGEEAGHEIASAVISYKFGLYGTVLRRCQSAESLLGDTAADRALKKAISIIREDAEMLKGSVPLREYEVAFSGEELRYLAVSIPDDQHEQFPGNLRDNALLMLYAVAVIASPDDREALDEQRKFAITSLEPYRDLLGG